MLGMAITGYVKGNVAELLAPVDGDGRICGFSGTTTGDFDFDATGYEYLYFPDVAWAMLNTGEMFKAGVCSERCPKQTDAVSCITTTFYSVGQGVECNEADTYSPSTYGTMERFGYCIPQKDTLTAAQQASYDSMINEFESSFFGSWVTDVYAARWVILTSIGIAVVIALLYIKLMDWFAVYVAWISVFLVEAGLIATGAMFYSYYHNVNRDNDGAWWGMFVCWFFAGLYCLLLLICCRALRISIAVIETAADWLADTKRILLVPLGYLALAIMVFIAWVCAAVMVCSFSSEPLTAKDVGSGGATSQAKNLEWGGDIYTMVYAMWFGIFWIIAFIISCNDFVVICSAVTWYYSRKDIPDSDGIPGDSQVWRGYVWSVRYHFGSLAFGSLVLALVWIIHWFFEYLGKKLHGATAGNCCTKCCLACCMCCIDCFDRFIRFIHLNAYIYMALSSESFCMSAVNAFLLVLKNSVKFAMVDTMAGFFTLIAKLCISISTTAIGFALMGPMLPEGVQLGEPFVPILFIFLMSYVIGAVFVSIFDAGANTMLQCYLMDMDIWRQKGVVDDRHVAAPLKKFFEHVEKK